MLPGLGTDAQRDPLFFLAGGPGQGAAKMAQPLSEVFRRVQTQRDIVLVNRYTGRLRVGYSGARAEHDCRGDSERTNASIPSTWHEPSPPILADHA